MAKSTIADTLNRMANAQSGRSVASRLRDIFPDIERALEAGVSRTAILKALEDDGLAITMKTFESALYRIRRSTKISEANTGIAGSSESRSASQKLTTSQQPEGKPHPFAGLGGNGRDSNAVHHSVPDKDRIYGRK
ncbi:hypothetical protein B7R56_11115 [Pseudomonas savastanoi pv. retacarpa]|uniref:Uncharacterized protein n=2 Tax=Pseudomonas syringae group TaxID=136849 RepID=A0A3M4JLS0_9PSED|nr:MULTISPECIES: hypothetical protein [Pseudomonas syringae group]KPY38401.1 putative mobilization protein [Pseudomonas savastanoi pv. retacarpa]KWS50411.1 hypothetical protein AL056_14335 [Pseudomonas amygdali pv. morsprunorum]OSR28323.1 hypothetical protein B7R56_11115 [Pseudomonas savastanoi pv. retacarpa]PHX27858.1 hypothetical protein AO282_07155 [Pseudomonas amygdali pv. morsprunorum]POP89600.1 hypothetical protein CXB39_26235 [Pseudomonas amygdali pv. morsprunorum]